jgi:hypothetical protein
MADHNMQVTIGAHRPNFGLPVLMLGKRSLPY